MTLPYRTISAAPSATPPTRTQPNKTAETTANGWLSSRISLARRCRRSLALIRALRRPARAWAASFRRRQTLEEHLAEAEDQVAWLREEMDDDPAAPSRRSAAARERQERPEEAQEGPDMFPLFTSLGHLK